MVTVEQTVARQADKLEAEAREYLRRAAEENIFYVALGKTYTKDIAEKYGLTEQQAGGLISKAAVELVDKIRNL